MGLFYMEYSVLALAVVYFARKITLKEIEKDRRENSSVAVKTGAAKKLQKASKV